MEAIEPFLIELDFDNQGIQSSSIIINQGNRNSITFQFKIFKGVNEIKYTDYAIAEVAFEKSNSALVVEPAILSANGISYTLHEKVIDTVGNVKGQIMLSKDNITAVTLHYSFKVVSDFSSIKRAGTFYVGVIERLLAEFNLLVQEQTLNMNLNTNEINKILTEFRIKADNSKAIITQITDDSIISINKTHSDFLDELQRLIDMQNLILLDINDGNFATISQVNERAKIILSKTQPSLMDENTYWLHDLGDSPDFGAISNEGLVFANVSESIPDDEGYYYETIDDEDGGEIII